MINEINVDFLVLPVSKYAEQLNQEAATNTVPGSVAHLDSKQQFGGSHSQTSAACKQSILHERTESMRRVDAQVEN